jgi:uncharacterized protein involved in exopolysaccharide biosynthesis
LSALQRYLFVLARHRRLVLVVVALATVSTAVYSLVARPVYTAVARLLPPVTDEPILTSVSSVLTTSGVGNLLRLGGSIRGSTPSDLVAAIVSSRTVKERVIDSCDFMQFYRRRRSRENALRDLSRNTGIAVGDEGIITISVNARSAAYAARLCSAYVSQLDRFLRESNMSRGRNIRIFVSQRLVDAEQELAAARDSLTAYQQRHHVTSVDDETKAAVDAYAELQVQKLSRDLELQIARQVAGSANPYVIGLQRRNDQFDRQLSRFEQGGGDSPHYGVGLGVPLKNVPAVAAVYAQLLADYRIKEELRALLVSQYEQARIAEVRDTPAITILDWPIPPERRSFPKRIRMTLIAFVLSLLTGVVGAFGAELWESQRRNPQAWEGWQQLRRTLLPRRNP